MKLYIEDNPTPSNNPAFILQMDATESPNGYTQTTNPEHWHAAWNVGYNIDDLKNNGVNILFNPHVFFRDYMIDNCLSDWNTYTDSQKNFLVKRFIYPNGTTQQDLDNLGTTSEDRQRWRFETLANMNISLCSSMYKFFNTYNDNTCVCERLSHSMGVITIDRFVVNSYSQIT